MKLQSPMDLFTLELQDMYSAENQLVDALPKMVKAAYDEKLKSGFEQHLKETKNQVKRLEKIGKILDIKIDGKVCEGMKGLIKEGEEASKLQGDEKLIDKALISGARKVEHYELIGYKSLIMLTRHVDSDEVKELLEENLHEEEMTDNKLKMLVKGDESMSAVEEMIQQGRQMFS